MPRLRFLNVRSHVLEQLESRRLLTVTYTIDPARSNITLDTTTSYYSGGSRFEAQRTSPSSIVDAISGSLVADLSGTTLTFQPDSLITAAQSPASPPAFSPAASAPGIDNFGIRDADSHGNFINGAVRDTTLLPAGSASFGGSVSGIQFSAVSGWVDYAINTGFFIVDGTRAFDATAVSNQSTDLLQESIADDVETITIPYRFDENFTVTTTNDTRVVVTGVIVATRSLGETPSTVLDRRLFYNQSAFDGNDGGLNLTGAANDDTAIATDKTAYVPGQGPMTMTGATFPNNPLSFQHVSSYSRGINGLMIDISGSHPDITASDFTFKVGNDNTPSSWSAASAPTSVTVRAGAGVSGSDRIELIFPNNSISNTWLQVIVKANATTGLIDDDVFFYGSRSGDSGAGDRASFLTNASDDIAARYNVGPDGVPITNRFDYNKDGLVTADDQLVSRNNAGFIPFLSILGPPAPPPAQLLATANADNAIAMALAAGATTAESANVEHLNYRAAAAQVFATLAPSEKHGHASSAAETWLVDDNAWISVPFTWQEQKLNAPPTPVDGIFGSGEVEMQILPEFDTVSR